LYKRDVAYAIVRQTPRFEIDEEIELYYNYKSGYRWTYVMWGLLANADRIINSVYIFKNFHDYCWQLNSDKQEDKLEVYWITSYNEKLIDYQNHCSLRDYE